MSIVIFLCSDILGPRSDYYVKVYHGSLQDRAEKAAHSARDLGLADRCVKFAEPVVMQ